MFNETNQVFPAEFSSAVFIGGDIVVVKLRYDGNTFTPEADDYIYRIATAYDNCKPIVLIANTGSNGEDRHYYLTESYPHNNGVDVVFAFQCNTGAETDVIYIDSVGDFEREVIANGSGGSPVEASGYRHIATYEHTADDGVAQIDITKDKDGNPFACSDFIIYLTLPTSEDIATNYTTQLYIGHKLWADWDLFIPQGFSREKTRRMRVHMYHAFDGYWLTDGVYNDNIDQLECCVPNINSTNSGFGNLKSTAATGKTMTELHFVAQSAFNNGTKIEIYGK